MCRIWILFCCFGIIKSSLPPSPTSLPYQPPWPILVAMPAYPFLPTRSNNELIPYNSTKVNNHNNNTNKSASDVGNNFERHFVTTAKLKEEIITKKEGIPSDVDDNYKLTNYTTDGYDIKVNNSTINLTTGISNPSDILTKPTAVDNVSSIDTTNKDHTEVTDKMNGNDFKTNKPKTEEDAPKTNNTFEIGNVKEKRLPMSTTGIKVNDKATKYFNNIFRGISHSTEKNHTTRTMDDDKYSIVNQQIIRPILGKVNDIGNVLQQIKSTAAQLRLISKSLESDPAALKKHKENINIVLHPKESIVSKNDTREEIVDIYEKISSVNTDEHVIKKVNYSNLELNDTHLLPILFPTSELDSQKLSFNNGNNNKKDKPASNIKDVSAKNIKQTTNNFLHADIKSVETGRNLKEHTLTHDVQRKITEATTLKRKGVPRRKKNKKTLPEVTFSSFIPIFKPKKRQNQNKKDVTERLSVSNDDVNIDVKVSDIPNLESPQNIQNVNKENVQKQDFNTKQYVIPNSEMSRSGLINNNALNTPQPQNQNIEFKNQAVNSFDGKKLAIYKPEKVSMCNVYGDFLEKLTMTVLVPYHVYKLTNS